VSGGIAADVIRLWYGHPAQMVRELFGVEPDAWQEEALEAFPHSKRIAMLASKGPGKTTVLAWLAWNFLLTRPKSEIAAVSVTADNLENGLWKEMSKWQQKSPLLLSLFVWKKTRIESRNPDWAPTWYMAARSWSKSASTQEQADTLAGLHADYVLFILDESGSIPDAVMVAADAALASGIENHIVQAGNPTELSGPLWRASQNRDKWLVIEVNGDPDNPKRSPRVDVEWARSMISEWGADSPYVLVNVFGRFPPASFNALIGPAEVDEAMRRAWREYDYGDAPKVLGIDVALYGDDASVIFPRQGLVAFNPTMYRNVNGTEGASIVNRRWAEWEPDAVFIDNTGGYGSSWIDNLLRLGRSPIGVAFSGKPYDKRFHRKRTEMAFDLVAWIRRGGQLPPANAPGANELRKALITTTYTVKDGVTILEPKDLVKAKLGFSPDHMDALMVTFAEPVQKVGRSHRQRAQVAAMAWMPEGLEQV
jgi:hypothetical protein